MDYGLGLRIDGTQKGPGFDAITLPDGSVVTELSAGNVENLYPLMYRGITPWNVDIVRNLAQYGTDPLQEDLYREAYQESLVRRMQRLSPFWTPEDGPSGLNRMDY